MDSILIVNAGSSSVKFQGFAIDSDGRLARQIKGQIDGIGNRPRLRAGGAKGEKLADRAYPIENVQDVPGALRVAGDWLREELRIMPIAVGHRVVHGGPDYDRPVLIDQGVVSRLEKLAPLAPLHQPYNLAPIRTLLSNFPSLPQVACFDTAFHRAHDDLADCYAIPRRLHEEGVRRYGFHGYPMSTSQGPSPELRRRSRADASSWLISAAVRQCVRSGEGAASKAPWGSRLAMGCRWAPGRDRSILA